MKKQRSRVLVVEDNPDDIEIMKRKLVGHDLDLEFAGSGKDGLEKLKRNKYDVVVADYSMPGMTGLDLLSVMKKEGLDTPFIMVTGAGNEKIAVEAMKKGAYDYLVKSFDPGWLDVFPSVIQNSIEKHCMRMEKAVAEKEKKRLEGQLQQARKMEAIGTLAGGIAHDFNNLLMGIQGNVSLMLMHTDPGDPLYERLKSIERQVQSGATLTSHLLGYARKGRYEVRPIDLNRLARETAETFGRTRKDIAVRMDLDERLFVVEADQGQMEQVLLNLLVNAGDAMPNGGDIRLTSANVTHENIESEVYEPNPGNYVLLTVTDTGKGMDEQTLQRIFDPFFTTKEMGRGTGLGLASAYGIIKGHGGYIDAASRIGHGTIFRIYLPASNKKARKAVRASDKILRGSETVLLVDDEEVVREVGKELLEAMGYRVLTAKDGKEAVEIYGENSNEIDIVFLDMVMPNMGGGDAYEKMKDINPNVKVLLSSGYSIDVHASEILEKGCDGFIQKPFTMRQLSVAIGKILRKK